MKNKLWLVPLLLITISLLLTSCGDVSNSSNDYYPPLNPTEKEEQRRRQVELECAMHPERCEDLDHLYIDDSNLPADPCREYNPEHYIGDRLRVQPRRLQQTGSR